MKTIKFSSNPDNIIRVEQLMEEIRAELKLEEETYYNILLALTEAATNAMRHGNKGDEQKQVEISYRLCNDDKSLLVIVKDEGPGFDYNHVPDPTAPENLERPGGRGVFLINALTEQVSFSDNGATVEMQFKI